MSDQVSASAEVPAGPGEPESLFAPSLSELEMRLRYLKRGLQ